MKHNLSATCLGLFILVVPAIVGCRSGVVQGPGQPAGSATIPDSHQWTIQSRLTHRTYQVQVSFPRGYDTTTVAYQAIYLLDANGQFGMTTEIVRNLSYFDSDSPGLIVVGIGYPVGQFYEAIGPRNFDLTPDRDTVWEASIVEEVPEAHPATTGGAADFLAFLKEELIPRVESEYRIDHSRRTLIGHSLGGLFALYTLLEDPTAFQQYLVISPSLWWGCSNDSTICRKDPTTPDGWVLRREEELHTAGESLAGRLYLTVGTDETPAMIEGPRRLVARLESRGYSDLDWTFEMLSGQWHMSIAPVAISNGLRWLHFGSP